MSVFLVKDCASWSTISLHPITHLKLLSWCFYFMHLFLILCACSVMINVLHSSNFLALKKCVKGQHGALYISSSQKVQFHKEHLNTFIPSPFRIKDDGIWNHIENKDVKYYQPSDVKR